MTYTTRLCSFGSSITFLYSSLFLLYASSLIFPASQTLISSFHFLVAPFYLFPHSCGSLTPVPLLTGVLAGHILDAAEVPLCPHAGGVVLVGELQAGAHVIVVGFDLSRHPLVVLEATGGGW